MLMKVYDVSEDIVASVGNVGETKNDSAGTRVEGMNDAQYDEIVRQVNKLLPLMRAAGLVTHEQYNKGMTRMHFGVTVEVKR